MAIAIKRLRAHGILSSRRETISPTPEMAGGATEMVGMGKGEGVGEIDGRRGTMEGAL